ncbi:MAG: 4-hydroxy-tetrahydrodipicolinate synthase [Chitinophagaceae bacterium]
MSLKKLLRGTGVALVTPFKKNQDIDFDALGRVIEFVIEGGVEYMVSLGTTGETPTLSKEEKRDIYNFTIEKTAQRVPLVVGIGGNDTREIINDLNAFDISKASAILSASPYYNKPSQEGIFQHYKAFAEAAPRPVILDNVPGRTGSNITAGTTLRLAHEVQNIAGIKEASGNMIQCMHILRDSPDNFLIVSGDDHLTLPLIGCGSDGVISVAANCFPGDFSQMVRLALENNFETARTLHYKCLEGIDLLFAENNPAGVKAFLSEMGLIENSLRLPVVPLSNAIHEEVKAYMAKLK